MKNKYPISPLIGFHGCDSSVANKVLAGSSHLKQSQNDYDWLGSGIYFWVDSYDRALDWAKKNKNIKTPYVVGAFIYPHNCLNLTDYGVGHELKNAYVVMRELYFAAGLPLPVNHPNSNDVSLLRKLDCAVINFTHSLREEKGELSFDTVYGVFEEGKPLYPNSVLKEKTHVQIAVRNTDCIIGYFRPKELSGH